MPKVILKGHIIVSTEQLPAVKAELPDHIALTKAEEGCLVFEVGQDSEDKTRFNVYEEFVDRTAFERHQQRVKSSRWGKVAAEVKRYYSLTEG